MDNENPKFTKKTIHTPVDLTELALEINVLLDKNEAAIRQYISRYIYTSSISHKTEELLEKLFSQIRTNLF